MDPTYSRSRSVVLIAIGEGGVVQKVYSCVGKLWVNSVSVPAVAEHRTVPDASRSSACGNITPHWAVFFMCTLNVTVDCGGITPLRLGEPVNVSKQASVTTPVGSAHQRMERVPGEA